VHKGDYIIFRAENDPLGILPENSKLVKKAACLSGMELIATDLAFICDGEYIAIRKDPDKMKFNYSGKIPEGKIFVVGSHERSYDSRIWGFLDESNIIGTVYPLF
jgi:type IV secretory pathway protease TraF